jgi:hypothetical protein
MSYDDRRRGPSVAHVLVGVFLVLFSLVLIFAGGGCTLMLLGSLTYPSGGDFPLLLISLAVLAGGLMAMWFGIRLIAGKYD